ncbi:hypothetical protein [Paractinoplanes lichenicola]|uniref:hypothetical protein n=1 Tax=Paractinoplanes lichenicola TaxID=2802976 RepID=UPI0034DABF49
MRRPDPDRRPPVALDDLEELAAVHERVLGPDDPETLGLLERLPGATGPRAPGDRRGADAALAPPRAGGPHPAGRADLRRPRAAPRAGRSADAARRCGARAPLRVDGPALHCPRRTPR